MQVVVCMMEASITTPLHIEFPSPYFLQMSVLMKGYTENVNKEGSILGDTLETALEYGEKFDELVTQYKAVSHNTILKYIIM